MPPRPAAARIASGTRSVPGPTVVAIVGQPDRVLVQRSIRGGVPG